MTSNLATAFQSERLVYTAIEDTDEIKNWFHQRFENEPVGRAFADSSLLRPQPRSRSEEVLADIRKSLLGVLICLPPATAPEKLAGRDKPRPADGDPAAAPKPTPIGVLHLDDESGPMYRHHHRLSVMSVCVISEYRDEGYGSEAIDWALDWAFTRANLHAVSLGCLEFNERGKHLYEKLGFVPEGRLRKCHWHERKWWDVLLYSMLEEEWLELRHGDKLSKVLTS
ncbi:putative gnat family [Diaporthe ampelina]|uniref:Putative gnat family n=1 Tax=Diaporthe ampelina TaxID=1214573 RepID=A0A0G2HWX9_9PEZI|nr:putative gnat family [Diaporthe ampelina]